MIFKRTYNFGPHGLVETDIEIPDELWTKWSDFHAETMMQGKAPKNFDLGKATLQIISILSPYEQLAVQCYKVSEALVNTVKQHDKEMAKK